jgi:hypothetical protein
MSNSQDQKIESGSWGKYFHQLPNSADEELNIHEYRLFGHYVRVAGAEGTCWETVRTTAENCGMGTTKVIETRASLHEKGYIVFTRTGNRRNSYHVKLNFDWLMRHNLDLIQELYNPDSTTPSPENAHRSPNQEHCVSNQEHSVPNQEAKKNSLRRTHKEELKDTPQNLSDFSGDNFDDSQDEFTEDDNAFHEVNETQTSTDEVDGLRREARLKAIQSSEVTDRKSIALDKGRSGSQRVNIADLPNEHIARVIVTMVSKHKSAYGKGKKTITLNQLGFLDDIIGISEGRTLPSPNELFELYPTQVRDHIEIHLRDAFTDWNKGDKSQSVTVKTAIEKFRLADMTHWGLLAYMYSRNIELIPRTEDEKWNDPAAKLERDMAHAKKYKNVKNPNSATQADIDKMLGITS